MPELIPIAIGFAVIAAALALYRYDAKFHAWIDTKISQGKATAVKLETDAKEAAQIVQSQAILLEKQVAAHLASKADVATPAPVAISPAPSVLSPTAS